MSVEIAFFLFIGWLLLSERASGWETRMGMTINGKGTGFQGVAGNVAENNSDSKRHVTLLSISSRTQRTCVAVLCGAPRCIMVRRLKEAAAPEFEEFEVSAKSGSHHRLFICGSPIR